MTATQYVSELCWVKEVKTQNSTHSVSKTSLETFKDRGSCNYNNYSYNWADKNPHLGDDAHNL